MKHTLNPAESNWKGLFQTGRVAAMCMLGIMVAQIVIFMAWPPPESVEGFFALFEKSWLLGLLSLDLLYLLNNALLIPIYLALYAALQRSAKSATLIALALGLVGIAAYYASNIAFEMLNLSSQYTAATSEVQKAVVLGAGTGMMAIYTGTAFNAYYVLNAASLLIFAVVMLRSNVFSKATSRIALLSGILMIIPSTAGMLGMIFSLLSLVPWAVFLVLIMQKFAQMGSAATQS